MKRKTLLSLFVIASFSPAFASAGVIYQVIDLGTLGGEPPGSLCRSTAFSVNNNGQIVGIATVGAGLVHATLFDATGTGNNIDLGTLGGRYSDACSINDKGQIVGRALDCSDDEHATFFDASGGWNNISLDEGGSLSRAESINNNGQIVGVSQFRAVLFDPTGSCNNIQLSPYESWAYSINNVGQIVGSIGHDYPHATLFDASGKGKNIDLGTLGGLSSYAYSINDSGQIVGRAKNSAGHDHATLFDPTGSGNNIDLGNLGGGGWSWAYSINNRGEIVGYAGDGPGGSAATMFDPSGNGNNIDLNTLIDPASRWALWVAYSISDRGWIVGEGIGPTGDLHAFLLIPEPGTIALLALGILCLRKRRA